MCIRDRCLTTLLFADDQIIIPCDEDDTDYMFRKLKEEYEKWGLNMNTTKTEYLTIKDMEEETQICKSIELELSLIHI